MPITKSLMRAKIVVAVLTATFVVAVAAPAQAGDLHFGTLPAIGNFRGITLNGNDQLTTASITPFTVIDDSGSGAGWNVSMVIPDFHNGTGDNCLTGSTATVSASALEMSAPVVAPADNDTSMTGVTAAGYTDFTFSRKIVTAAAGAGAGTYAISPEILRLIVPANAFPGAYCSKATIAVSEGP